MIIAAVVLLLLGVVCLAVGLLLGRDGVALLWGAAVAAPLSLAGLWVGLRRLHPRRGRRHP